MDAKQAWRATEWPVLPRRDIECSPILCDSSAREDMETRQRPHPLSIDISTIVQAVLNAIPSPWSCCPLTVMAIPLH